MYQPWSPYHSLCGISRGNNQADYLLTTVGFNVANIDRKLYSSVRAGNEQRDIVCGIENCDRWRTGVGKGRKRDGCPSEGAAIACSSRRISVHRSGPLRRGINEAALATN